MYKLGCKLGACMSVDWSCDELIDLQGWPKDAPPYSFSDADLGWESEEKNLLGGALARKRCRWRSSAPRRAWDADAVREHDAERGHGGHVGPIDRPADK